MTHSREHRTASTTDARTHDRVSARHASSRLASIETHHRIDADDARDTVATLEASRDRLASRCERLKVAARESREAVIARKAELRALTANLGLHEERERRRIAAGLHDDIGHTLALAKLRLGQLLEADGSSGTTEAIREIDDFLDQAIAATRSLTFELSSPVLYELGFEAAIESLGEELEHHHGIRFEFRAAPGPGTVAGDSTVTLYRVVRELLNNVAVHARARNAIVSVRIAHDRIRIEVEDDGVGFDATGAGDGFGPEGGFGLFSINEQLGHIGGRLEIESRAGRGTRAVVVAPVAPSEDESA